MTNDFNSMTGDFLNQEEKESRTEDDYIKFLDILEENLEGFYYYHLPGSYHGKEAKFYYWYYEDSDEIVVYNSANDLNNDFTTARELVENVFKVFKRINQ